MERLGPQVERGPPQNHKWEARFLLDVITGAVQLQLQQQADVYQCYYRVNTIQIATSESHLSPKLLLLKSEVQR